MKIYGLITDDLFSINDSKVNGFNYDPGKGDLQLTYLDDDGVNRTVADITFSRGKWNKFSRCKEDRLWEKIKNLFADS